MVFAKEQIETDPILKFFTADHLKSPMQEIGDSFASMAMYIVTTVPRNAERTVALRKLLEAKDAAVRAVLP